MRVAIAAMRLMIVAAVAASLLVMLVVRHVELAGDAHRTRLRATAEGLRPRTGDNSDVVKTPGGSDTTPPVVPPSTTITTRGVAGGIRP